MKQGDLVYFTADTCSDIGDPGIGTIISIEQVNFGVENEQKALVLWPKISVTNWHFLQNLEVVS